MQYEPLGEKTPIQSTSLDSLGEKLPIQSTPYEPLGSTTPMQPLHLAQPELNSDYKQNSDVRRTRTILLVVLGIQLVLSVIYFFSRMVDMIKFYRLRAETGEGGSGGSYIGSFILAFVAVIYIVAFILVAFYYLRIGILVFAWLGLIQLILVIITVILALGIVITISAVVSSAILGIVGTAIVIGTAGFLCLLTILAVAFAFTLAKHLKKHEAYQYV